MKKMYCWHCRAKVVIDEDSDVKGFVHGVIPTWIYELESKKFIKNINRYALCLKCANSKVK